MQNKVGITIERWIWFVLAIAVLTRTVTIAKGQDAPPLHYNYVEGCAESVRTNKPLIVWVGCRALFDVPNTVTAIAPTLSGYPQQCVVIADPKNESIWWRTTLSNPVSMVTLEKEVNRKAAIVSFRQHQHCPT